MYSLLTCWCQILPYCIVDVPLPVDCWSHDYIQCYLNQAQIYHRKRLFLCMPRRMWQVDFKCPTCASQSLRSKGLYNNIRMVLDSKDYYNLAAEYMDCRYPYLCTLFLIMLKLVRLFQFTTLITLLYNMYVQGLQRDLPTYPGTQGCSASSHLVSCPTSQWC